MKINLSKVLWTLFVPVCFISCDPAVENPPHPMVGTYKGDCYLFNQWFTQGNGATVQLDTFWGKTYVIYGIMATEDDSLCRFHTSNEQAYFPLGCDDLGQDTIFSRLKYNSYNSISHEWHRADGTLTFRHGTTALHPGYLKTLTCYFHRVQ